MAVINSPFESQYGFKGPGFSVDSLGNITATSVITSSVVADNSIVDFTVTEQGPNFSFATIAGDNPAITLSRSKSYKFKITVPNLAFKIYQADKSALYDVGLTHSDGSVGGEAQGKTSGTLAIALPNDAPDVLYYGSANGTIFGTINVIDPSGRFSTLDVNATTVATSSSTGALTVAGGLGVAGDLFVGGTLNIDGLGITSISSPTDLQLEAANNIIIKIDGTSLGVVTATGSSVPVVNTSINNTVIGATTPSTAVFTSATIATLPSSNVAVTNKQYVDSTALSLSIAFGL